MAERMGRVGRGAGDLEVPREAEADLGSSGRRPNVRGLTGLFALAVSGLVLYFTWWVLWERSHPASEAARRVRQGDAAARLEAIRELETLGPQDPDVAMPGLILGLADPDPGNRATAAGGLAAVVQGGGSLGLDPEAVRYSVAALMVRLDDPEAAVRVRAAQGLCSIVMSRRGSLPDLDADALEAEMTRMADDPDVEARRAAVQGLATIAREAAHYPPARLFAALEDEAEMVRAAAADGLSLFHIHLSRMIPTVVTAMGKARPECRPAYLSVLRRFGPWQYPGETTGEMIPLLISALGMRDSQVRCQVAETLGAFGPRAREAIPALLGLLDDPGVPGLPGPGNEGYQRTRDPAIAAAEALRQVAGGEARTRPSGRTPVVAEVVAALIHLASAPTAGRRLAATHALTSFEADDAIVAALIAASRDRDEWVRVAGLRALQGRGSRLRSRTLETIREAMEDRSPDVRCAAANALWGLGGGAESMVPDLIRHAEHDPDPAVQQECASVLGSLGPPAITPAVVPMYVAAIERPGASPWIVGNLVGALTGLGPTARDGVPAIARVLRWNRPVVGPPPTPHPRPAPGVEGMRSTEAERAALGRNAARALGALAPGTPYADEALSALIEAVDDPADEVSLQVCESLLAFGPLARAATPNLLIALRGARARNDLRRAARMAEAMGRIDPASPSAGEAVAFLEEVLRSEDSLARQFALRVLMLFGESAAPTIPALVALSRRPAIRTSPELPAIATALGRIAPGTPWSDQAVAALLEWLRAEPESPGFEAGIVALARFGPGAAAALPRLRELTKSGTPPIAEAARKGVAAVSPGG